MTVSPERWRAADPDLFDRMGRLIVIEARTVGAVEASGILPNAHFHTELVPRRVDERRTHFEWTFEIARGSELVFFDPGNGLEVSSCAPGRVGSEKYLLWSELVAAFSAGHSVLVYQHFPRRERTGYVRATAQLIGQRTGSDTVLAFRASVVFSSPHSAWPGMVHRSRALSLASKWKDIITVDVKVPD